MCLSIASSTSLIDTDSVNNRKYGVKLENEKAYVTVNWKDVKITSKLDTNSLSQVTIYFNFLNYCILAGCVYVICLIAFL